MGQVLSKEETRAILDAVAGLRGKFPHPVVIVDRTGPKARAEVYDREQLLEATNDGSEQWRNLARLLTPTDYPFIRVVVYTPDGAASLRIARAGSFAKGVA